jgi:hypothetical protein
VKAALMYAAGHIDAVEMAGTVINLARHTYSDYIGRIFEDPRVTLIEGEGRSYLRSTNKKYDAIQIFSNHLSSAVTNREVALRASIGLSVFVPAGLDEAMLAQVGFEVEQVEDRTRNMAENAAGWRDARSKRDRDLRAIEGDEAFDGQQLFLETAATLAREKRLSRIAILARRPP